MAPISAERCRQAKACERGADNIHIRRGADCARKRALIKLARTWRGEDWLMPQWMEALDVTLSQFSAGMYNPPPSAPGSAQTCCDDLDRSVVVVGDEEGL